MRTTLLPAVLVSALLIASCGDDDSSSEDSSAADAASADTDGVADDPAAADTVGDVPQDSDAGPEPEAEADPSTEGDDGSGGEIPPGVTEGSATLTLENGETFEVDVFCTLEPQISAGSEILFTATSLGDPILDITQFGDEGPVTEIGSVQVINGDTYESLWGASTIYEPFGGALELSLDGSTINGSGDFYPGDDPVEGGDPVPGEVVADC
ncbi:hypothetical protein [Ilumatobacter nonamiensis]|uniref:hypothetical protein n=1 Tax=Ilumatobacter nonamiensis TaxID=467093 RepID=UPI000345264E|nr:hypothetical protein [Ilumatobacter nonamiensis]